MLWEVPISSVTSEVRPIAAGATTRTLTLLSRKPAGI